MCIRDSPGSPPGYSSPRAPLPIPSILQLEQLLPPAPVHLPCVFLPRISRASPYYRRACPPLSTAIYPRSLRLTGPL
eukprot:3791257-Pyramimonas_sp.AAC.2